MLKPFYNKTYCEAGCDEAGRGCLAGPVVAAAVILPSDFYHPLLNDSKQLSHAQRLELKPIIMEYAVSWAIAETDNHEIDKINILNASILAMHRAVEKLHITPNLLLIDGNRFKTYPDIAHLCVIKGDSIFASIAAASILAKTHRDELMDKWHEDFPHYRWSANKGYPTVDHRAAIEIHGTTDLHRLSFRLLAKSDH
ncbi:MAG: ribonuclease HII [Flavobacteriales bacterium]|nr:ribonuclease HII [Flavobacteriales bacterium]